MSMFNQEPMTQEEFNQWLLALDGREKIDWLTPEVEVEELETEMDREFIMKNILEKEI